ncbi:MAG: hypothetical protein LBT21_04645 [Oscillospiraceae bacterium]|jgi:hypothetical protein|nr:hypothetical protein [Oscillospiraceae bacterium]
MADLQATLEKVLEAVADWFTGDAGAADLGVTVFLKGLFDTIVGAIWPNAAK